MSDEKAIVPLDVEPPVRQEPEPTEMLAVQAKTISKFAEASMIDYTDTEKAILFAPIDVKDIKVRPDGQIYAEWGWYADRLDAAFGQGQWSLSPAPWSPRLFREGNITYREYVLWIRGQFAGNAIGHHEEQRRTANFGDAAEATYANALVRLCKRLGIARDLWKKDKIDEFKKQLKSGSKAEVKGEAAGKSSMSDSSSTVNAGGPTPSPLYAHCKDQMENAGNIDELKAIWGFAVKHQKEMQSTEFVALEVLKNKRKAEMSFGEVFDAQEVK